VVSTEEERPTLRVLDERDRVVTTAEQGALPPPTAIR
jgi:hypothetical protein